MFSTRLDEKTLANLLTTLDDSGRARLRSCGGPLAAAWQWASPPKPGETLVDNDYRYTAPALLSSQWLHRKPPATTAPAQALQLEARVENNSGPKRTTHTSAPVEAASNNAAATSST